MAILNREAGKAIPDCMSEVRETIDYCRYYAYRATQDMVPHELPGPTGESNMWYYIHAVVMACISPWNFPLAIFAGQIIAALAAGNTVLAKPAEQTPYIAFRTVQILHEAGVPKSALQLCIGRGSVVGAKMVSDERIAGVMFTGSTETAKFIERSLANRNGPTAVLVAETGGQNAMIVDSSALAEQTVADVALSAFNSAANAAPRYACYSYKKISPPKFSPCCKVTWLNSRLGIQAGCIMILARSSTKPPKKCWKHIVPKCRQRAS